MSLSARTRGSLAVLLWLAVTGPTAHGADDLPPGLLGEAVHGRGAISGEYIYTGEIFTNMRGGIGTHRATHYMGLLDLTLAADFEELGLWRGGRFVVFAQDMHGRGITEQFVGDFQVLSNIDAPDRMQVSEYFWEQNWLDGQLRTVIGKIDANAEFAVVPIAGEFINSSFGFHPTVPMPTYPDPSAGVAVFWDVNEWFRLAGGVWDGEPDGRNWGVSGSGSIFSIYEAEIHYRLFGKLPGQAHASIWHHSGPVESLLDPGREFADNYGAECEAQQMLLREDRNDKDNEQGLYTLFQFGWSPNDRNEINQYYGAGLLYRGPLRGRDNDSAGVGVAHVIFSDELPNMDYETVVEVFYSVQLIPWIRIQPDLQYIAHPSGRYRDAFVYGTRFEIAW